MLNKKLIGILMGTMITAAAFVGCGASSADTAEPATETVAEDTAEETTEAADEAAETETSAEGELVDVGGAYPVSTEYDEWQLVDYYIAEMDETPQMVVARTSDGTKYQAHFDFFGDEQLLEFTVDNGTPEVTEDLTGFMAKDVEAIYDAIQESDNWQPVQ